MPAAIRATEDFRRIVSLPRRAPDPPHGLAEELTELLKRPGGTMTLRPLQALALLEIGTHGGGFLPLDVGEGKTLISLLAPYVLESKRTLLLLPANLIEKTARERDELAKHWLIPERGLRLMSYQILGLVQSADELELYKPDLIVCDEVQKLKNLDAAVTRRVVRYMAKHSSTRFVGMTGTIMRKSFLDFAHVLLWCLKTGAPVPFDKAEREEWALALDEKIENEWQRIEPGALLELCTPEERRTLPPETAARRGFRRRLRETPGIVSSHASGTHVTVPLEIRALRYDLSPKTIGYFRDLRNDGVTPDGWEVMEAVDVWRHCKEIALGFHQVWDPRPPEPWRTARRNWFAFVRTILSRSRTYDSPEHVAQACDAGRLPSGELNAWRAIKDTFIPNPVPIWHDDSALHVAAGWMREPGMVWTEHTAFAERLAQITGAKYYGAKGLAADGEFVDDADPSEAIIISADANREGRNLQRKWSRNLIVSPEEGADKWHQLIGRTHRPGQTATVVTVDVFLGCAEHVRAWDKAIAGAHSIRDTVGSQNKLLIADIDWPSAAEIATWSGPRWDR